ncbi:MAG: TPR end-of-group domain-containing protein, partial [Candidatus Acidiferrales bacterium]
VRVTAQLIRASDQTHVWAQNYDRELGNILDVQFEVARAVAAEIQLQLAENSQGAPDEGPRIRSEAHEAYLRGRYFLDQRTPEAVLAARRWFERATSVQPDYARAWVGLADSQILAVSYANAPPEPAMREARESVLKALALDSRLPEAHAWLGVIQTEYDWDWAGAERSLRRAVELDPNFAYAHKLYAEYLSYVGRGDEAVAEARLAQQLDPLSVVTNSMLGIALYRARRYDEAVRELDATVKLDPSHPLPYLPLGLAYSQLGRSQEAVAALERTLSLTADNSEMIAQLGYVRARAGQTEQARTLLDELARRSRNHYVSPFHFAIVYTGLGETQHALEWLEQGYEQRDWLMCVVKTDPIFDPLRREPPFQALLRRMNFPE